MREAVGGEEEGGVSGSVWDEESVDEKVLVSGGVMEEHSDGEAMAIAVAICWATTHPIIFSRVVEVVEGMRNRYTFEA